MAGEPALDKVLTALKTALDPLAGTTDIDRPEEDAYGNAELPARNIIHRGTSFEQVTYGETLHRARIDIGMVVETKAASTIGSRLREMEAETVETLWADRTLGGVAQDIVPASSDAELSADNGEQTLSIEILFLTPVGDHRTIIGAAGLIP